MADFKIGIMADSLKLPFRESLQTARRLGADGVQIYAVEGEMAPENLNAAARAEKRRMIEDCGLEVSALCGDLGGHGFTRRDENPDKIARSKRIVDLALELGSRIVTTHIGVVPADVHSDVYRVLQEACNELGEYAEQNGARFAIETGPEPAARLKAFLDSLDNDGVAVNFDPANLVMCSGDDPAAAVYLLRDYIVHTHAKDGIRKIAVDPRRIYAANFYGIPPAPAGAFEEVPLGEGGVDWNAYLAALRDIGYDGFLTVERECGEKPAEDIGRAVRFLKERI